MEITKSYGRAEWREDLMKVLKRAGAERQPSVFLFSDAQVHFHKRHSLYWATGMCGWWCPSLVLLRCTFISGILSNGPLECAAGGVLV